MSEIIESNEHVHSTKIHPTAIVSKQAQLGVNVHIGPYSVIGPHAVVDDHVNIGAHVVIE